MSQFIRQVWAFVVAAFIAWPCLVASQPIPEPPAAEPEPPAAELDPVVSEPPSPAEDPETSAAPAARTSAAPEPTPSTDSAEASEIPVPETFNTADTLVDAASEPSTGERALGAGLAVIPGFFVHGLGHWVIDEPDTAYRLLAVEGVGIALIMSSLAGLAITGASDTFIVPSVWAANAGAGLFMGSFFSDVYGVVTPKEGTGSPRTRSHVFEAVAGYQYVNNPAFKYRNFMHLGLEGRWSSLRLTPCAWIAAADDNWRLEIDSALRFVGPQPRRRSEDGSFLDLEGGYAYHAYTSDGFGSHALDLLVHGRYDMRRLGKTMSGSFLDLSLGMGVQAYDREFGGRDFHSILLGGFAWGFYLGHDSDGWGEFALVYDHRHDDFAAGFKFPGIGSGVTGSFGIRLDKRVWQNWGLRTHVQFGSAIVGSLNMVYRYGGDR